MTILIVDDEDLTRRGLISSIKNLELPITDLYEADDGLKGVRVATEKRPDIILSDIRMAKMSGIDMVDELKERLPDSAFIFMSGYSDRDYLKAAIRLKAVSFIEKPIDLKELKNVLMEAIRTIEDLKFSHESKLLHNRAASRQLALRLTLSPEEAGDLPGELSEGSVSDMVKKNRYITTFIVKTVQSLSLMDAEEKKRINDAFDAFLSGMRCAEINMEKHDQHLVYHVFSPERLEKNRIERIGKALKEALGEKRFFISAGQSVSGMEKAFISYNQAVVLLQSAFFNDYGCIIFDSKEELLPAPKVLPDPSGAYLLALLSGDAAKVRETEEQIERSLSDSRNLMPDQVRDIYYKLFISVYDAYKNLSIYPENAFASSESLLSFVQERNTLKELSDALRERSEELLSSMEKDESENPVVLEIKVFISRNYSRENLSVKEISEHVHLSSTYICTLFKNETGVTLNQYITLYRMDKAKELLSDPKNKIADISAKVGYSDGNYFGKSFKKTVGMTPGEYRAQVII